MRWVLLVYMLLWSLGLSAQPLTFALIPKSTDSPFFAQARAGCEQAAEALGVRCLYVGSPDLDIRQQNHLVETLMEEGIDGIALSVAGSAFLVNHSMQAAMASGLPVVTFDSDFAAEDLARYPELRRAYIGTDNYALGHAIGEAVLRERPRGGKLCVISGHVLSPNLQRRINGLRDALAADRPAPGHSARLNTAQWSEFYRCPMYSRDDIARSRQLTSFALRVHQEHPDQLDTVAILGSWPQSDADAYRQLIGPYLNAIRSKALVMVIGDTLPQQLELLNEGGAHANIGQNAFEMGRQAIHTLYRIVKGESYEKITHTPITHCLPETLSTCTR
ncbi:substrate-binding domain-containing protein [Aestuariirhabdus sp. LZHN29]|uniref:substrate-binding domain-containing protein n=1 Tax=Aestuariirhabdus sp. LZHN29 TaxID=3417462 RepID=UPI003CF08A76